MRELFSTHQGMILLGFISIAFIGPIGFMTSAKTGWRFIAALLALSAIGFALFQLNIASTEWYIVSLGMALGVGFGKLWGLSYANAKKAEELRQRTAEFAQDVAELAEAAKKAEAARLDALFKGPPAFNNCPNCTAPLAPRNIAGKLKLACTHPRCKFVHWDNPKVVGVVLVPSSDGTGLLLIKRSIPPRVGFYALPGGYVDTNEGFEEGCIREAKEETGLDVTIDRPFWSVPIKGKNEILTFYVATVVGGSITTSDETSVVEFFPLDKIPEEIAFPTHRQAIDMWIASRKAA